MSTKFLLTAAVCMATQMIAPSIVLANHAKNKITLSEENLQQLQERFNRNDYRAAESLNTAKQFAKEEKYEKADSAFKQAEELMLAYKGDQFFLKIVYKAQLYYLKQHSRTAEYEAVDAKLKAAELRIPHSQSYEGYVSGPEVNQNQTMKTQPTLPDGPPIPDDQ